MGKVIKDGTIITVKLTDARLVISNPFTNVREPLSAVAQLQEKEKAPEGKDAT